MIIVLELQHPQKSKDLAFFSKPTQWKKNLKVVSISMKIVHYKFGILTFV